MRKNIIFAIILIVIVSFFVFVLIREPQHDRVWDAEVQYMATALFNEDGSVSIQNVRDFTYGDNVVVSTDWVSEVVVDPSNVVKAWFVLEPFTKWEAVGHTLLTFELSDGSAYSFSVEARREKDEIYSALKGLFNEYELIYSWGTERDFITRRLLYLENPVRMYPLTIDSGQAQKLFIGLLEKTNDVSQKPRFYNTFNANCTNVLAEIVNEIKPGTIPWDISWYLPGYSDRFLMRIGLIKTEQTIEQTQKIYDITKDRSSILNLDMTSSHAQFGKNLREFLP